MHVAGGVRGVDQAAVRARGDGDVVDLDDVQHADRVGCHLLEGLVARDGRDRHELELWARDCQHEGHRVVVARVAVDDHRLRHCASSWRFACSNAVMHIAALILTAAFAQAAPTATTGAAESITTGSAAVTGTVNPGGDATTYQFEYGTSSSYGLTTPAVDAGSGTTDVAAKATLSSLTNNTTYHYRLVATNAAGVARGADKTFKTAAPASAPSISSRAATAVTSLSATLNARVNPRALATTVRFEYGTSTAYGTVDAGAGDRRRQLDASSVSAGDRRASSRARSTTTAPWPRAPRASPAAATARSRPRRRRPAWRSPPRRSARCGAAA